MTFLLFWFVCLFWRFEAAHGKRQPEANVATAGERMVATLEVASGLVFEIGVESTAADAHNRFRYVQCRVGRVRQRRRRPFPHVTDQLVNTANACAAGEL